MVFGRPQNVMCNRMKNLTKIIGLTISIIVIGCGQADQTLKPLPKQDTLSTSKTVEIKQDTSNQDIYDFMKVVIADQHLELKNGLTLEPELGCDLSQDDKTFLISLLIQPPTTKPKTDTGFTFTTYSPMDNLKCLTKSDIKSMLKQKEKYISFKWDNSRLGFDLHNDKQWYCFSIPLFSQDKTKAVMMIRDLCPGLCGTGSTILFTKEKDKWTSVTGGPWIH